MTFYTTPQVAAAARTTLRAVRLWDSKGMLGPVQRNKRGERLFNEPQLERAKTISAASMAGMGLDEIQAAHWSQIKMKISDGFEFMKSVLETKGFDL